VQVLLIITYAMGGLDGVISCICQCLCVLEEIRLEQLELSTPESVEN